MNRVCVLVLEMATAKEMKNIFDDAEVGSETVSLKGYGHAVWIWILVVESGIQSMKGCGLDDEVAQNESGSGNGKEKMSKSACS